MGFGLYVEGYLQQCTLVAAEPAQIHTSFQLVIFRREHGFTYAVRPNHRSYFCRAIANAVLRFMGTLC